MRARYRIVYFAEASTTDALTRDPAPVADALGLDLYTARQRLVAAGLTALASFESAAEADAALLELRALGLEVLLFDRDAALPERPVRVRSVDWGDDGATLRGLDHETVGRLAAADRLLVVPVHVLDPARLLEGRPNPDALSARSAVDLLTGAGEWFRVVPTGFDYRCLGAAMTEAQTLNLRRLLERLDGEVAETELHLGHPGNHGRPEGPDEAREYTRWAWSAWQQGLLRRAEPEVAPLPRLASPARGVVDAPAPRTAEGGLLVEPPACIYEGWHLPWFDDRAELVGAVALGALAVALAWTPVGLGVAGGGLVALGARRLARAARLSRPTRVHGRADADAPLRAPLTGVACVWYRVLVERRVEGAGFPWGWLTWGRWGWWRSHARPERWQTMVRGDSGDARFFVDTRMGRVEVDPSDARPLLAAPPREEVMRHGARHRITEWMIPVGAEVFAVGRLARSGGAVAALRALKADPAALARYDANDDGRVDAEEWEAARRDVTARHADEERRALTGVGFFGLGHADDRARRAWLWGGGMSAAGAVALLAALL